MVGAVVAFVAAGAKRIGVDRGNAFQATQGQRYFGGGKGEGEVEVEGEVEGGGSGASQTERWQK